MAPASVLNSKAMWHQVPIQNLWSMSQVKPTQFQLHVVSPDITNKLATASAKLQRPGLAYEPAPQPCCRFPCFPLHVYCTLWMVLPLLSPLLLGLSSLNSPHPLVLALLSQLFLNFLVSSSFQGRRWLLLLHQQSSLWTSLSWSYTTHTSRMQLRWG